MTDQIPYQRPSDHEIARIKRALERNRKHRNEIESKRIPKERKPQEVSYVIACL